MMKPSGKWGMAGLSKGSMTLLLFAFISFCGFNCNHGRVEQPAFGLVIHGGAGTLSKEILSAEDEAAYQQQLTAALEAGHALLRDGGAALDAVETVIVLLEDSPLFNAGRGAVFNSAGKNELDASLMDGRTLEAGAVASVRHVKNPIKLARLVMEQSPHVLMAGDGAEVFGKEHDIELVPADYFFTQRRWDALQRAKARAAEPEGHGTVGAVALDKHGNLAAGTSTGGMTNKLYGRIGDSPIIGAGTYADNRTCAVSCTGHGEYYIRLALAHNISSLMAHGGLTLKEAAHKMVMEELEALGGVGGVIAIDRQGSITMVFNTQGMFRGHMQAGGSPVVEIFGD